MAEPCGASCWAASTSELCRSSLSGWMKRQSTRLFYWARELRNVAWRALEFTRPTLVLTGPIPCKISALHDFDMGFFPLEANICSSWPTVCLEEAPPKAQITLNSTKWIEISNRNTGIIRALPGHSLMSLRLVFFIFNMRITSYLIGVLWEPCEITNAQENIVKCYTNIH